MLFVTYITRKRSACFRKKDAYIKNSLRADLDIIENADCKMYVINGLPSDASVSIKFIYKSCQCPLRLVNVKCYATIGIHNFSHK